MSEALLIIDVQNDFCPGGALAVPEGDQVVPLINAMQDRFDAVVLTQDWHPSQHSSFAANHAGVEPYSMVEMPYGSQVLWPVHCVQGTDGAEMHSGLETNRADLVIRKGSRAEIDTDVDRKHLRSVSFGRKHANEPPSDLTHVYVRIPLLINHRASPRGLLSDAGSVPRRPSQRLTSSCSMEFMWS